MMGMWVTPRGQSIYNCTINTAASTWALSVCEAPALKHLPRILIYCQPQPLAGPRSTQWERWLCSIPFLSVPSSPDPGLLFSSLCDCADMSHRAVSSMTNPPLRFVWSSITKPSRSPQGEGKQDGQIHQWLSILLRILGSHFVHPPAAGDRPAWALASPLHLPGKLQSHGALKGFANGCPAVLPAHLVSEPPPAFSRALFPMVWSNMGIRAPFFHQRSQNSTSNFHGRIFFLVMVCFQERDLSVHAVLTPG